MLIFIQIEGCLKRLDRVHISQLSAIRNFSLQKPTQIEHRTCFISRECLPCSRLCLLVMFHDIRYFMACLCCPNGNLYEKKTHLEFRSRTFFIRICKWPKSGLKLINFYVSHPTEAAAKKKSKRSSIFNFFRISETFFQI